MLITRQNRLLPILTGIVVLMLILVLMRACSDVDEAPATLDAVPVAARPDADTPADTIETLTANVAAMTEELQRLREANAELKIDNDTLAAREADIQQQFEARIVEVLAVQDDDAAAREDRDALTMLQQRVDALVEAVGSERSASVDLIGIGVDRATRSN